MLILIVSIIIAAMVRLLTYKQAEKCLHVKDLDVEQLK